MCAATYGTVTFISNRRTYTKDVYLDDTAANPARWDAGAGAGASSPDHWIASENCRIIDFSVVTGYARVGSQVVINGVNTGDFLRYANHLNTLYRRNPVSIPIVAGSKIMLNQV